MFYNIMYVQILFRGFLATMSDRLRVGQWRMAGVPYVLVNGVALSETKDFLKKVCEAYEGDCPYIGSVTKQHYRGV